MNVLILFSLVFSKIQIQNQSFYFSEILTDEELYVPKHCFIVGYPCLEKSILKNYKQEINTIGNENNFVNKFILFKPIRKMYEYEYDIERGIELTSSNKQFKNLDDRVLDSINYPDFSSQAVGIAIGGILLALLFKLFS